MKKIVMLFPGQGAQYVGMGEKIIKNYPTMKQVFEEAEDSIGINLRKLCFEESIDELTKTQNAQPAILTVSVAAFKVYMQEFGIEPSYLAGHSLGEFSALCCSGVIDFSDAVKIVRQRGKFMQEAASSGNGSMAAVGGISVKEIEKLCKEFTNDSELVSISNYNSPSQIVVSGHKGAVLKLGEKVTAMNGKFTPLNVSAAFHSNIMSDAANKFKHELSKYTFKEFKYPVISNVNGLPYSGVEAIRENLVNQLIKPVRWSDSMKYLVDSGVEVAIDVGPQKILRNLMKKNSQSIDAYSLDFKNDIVDLRNTLGIENKVKDDYLKVLSKCIAVAISTKNRNWDNDQYYNGVIVPYRKMVEMNEKVEKSGNVAMKQDALDAVNLLKQIFDTKKVPDMERRERFNQIFEEAGISEYTNNFEFK